MPVWLSGKVGYSYNPIELPISPKPDVAKPLLYEHRAFPLIPNPMWRSHPSTSIALK
ncbi:hypothetical protein [Dactylococcopsis salina]|uniref:hypothetical protein n=1 Tax=Dactylococcopsis salina TaxID=292566 RepID=UPI0012EAC381|nr:hypothetical protein [Dactylococcopsis salina]